MNADEILRQCVEVGDRLMAAIKAGEVQWTKGEPATGDTPAGVIVESFRGKHPKYNVVTARWTEGERQSHEGIVTTLAAQITLVRLTPEQAKICFDNAKLSHENQEGQISTTA